MGTAVMVVTVSALWLAVLGLVLVVIGRRRRAGHPGAPGSAPSPVTQVDPAAGASRPSSPSVTGPTSATPGTTVLPGPPVTPAGGSPGAVAPEGAAARSPIDPTAVTQPDTGTAPSTTLPAGGGSGRSVLTAGAAHGGELASPAVDSGAATSAELRRVRDEVEEELRSVRADIRAQRTDLERREHRLTERESRLDEQARHLEERARELAAQHADLATQHAEIDARQAELADRRVELAGLEQERRLVLERTAGLTAEAARAELVALVENQAKRDAAVLVRDIEREAVTEGETRARRIIVSAIQRLATEQTTESVVSVLHLPSDDMKGRIIGREGRNIRTFESVTGVNLIIDDTPEAVLLSCFDPVRREIGRITLEALVLDGRIHPQRIEDAHERARAEVEALCIRAGEDALVDVGITDLHPELVGLLGRLRYRTSYGQNVLMHLLESAHVAGMMASELGLDPVLMRRCALLHDIGKALTHEVEGSHAIIGAEVARKYGESDDVVHAIEAHHNEVEPRTIEAVLTQAADAISGGRPGARRESLEAYVKRLERLEEIATSYDGVEKVFAMQAGREVRVMVLPEQVDDIQAQVIAREIAKQVEHELTYPGQIRVTVVRESRATEVAR